MEEIQKFQVQEKSGYIKNRIQLDDYENVLCAEPSYWREKINTNMRKHLSAVKKNIRFGKTVLHLNTYENKTPVNECHDAVVGSKVCFRARRSNDNDKKPHAYTDDTWIHRKHGEVPSVLFSPC